MSSEKSLAIVLRVIEFSETSCIVTLLTRDFGKITAMAKGARRAKSPFEAALDVLAICRIVFLHKSSGAMDLLTEAKLERRFRSSSSDLQRLYAAYYVIELVRLLTEEKDPHPELFDVASETINEIDDPSRNSSTLNLLLLQFELNMLRLLGHLPMLTKCVDCGRERKTQNRVSFGLNAGGLLCQQCRRGKQNIVSLSSEGVDLLLRLARNQENDTEPQLEPWRNESWPTATVVKENQSDLFEPKKDNKESNTKYSNNVLVGGDLPTDLKLEAPSQTVEDLATIDLDEQPNEAVEVRNLINSYLTHLLGFPPRLHKFLKNL